MKLARIALAAGLLVSLASLAHAQDDDGMSAPANASAFKTLSLTSKYENDEPGYETYYSRQRAALSDYDFTVSSGGDYTITSPGTSPCGGSTKGKLSPSVLARLNELVKDSKMSTGQAPAYRSSIEGHGAALQPFTITADFAKGTSTKLTGVAQSAYMIYGPKSKTPLVDFLLKLSFTTRWLQAGAPSDSLPVADDPALRSVILDQLKDPKLDDARLASVLTYLGDISKVHDDRYKLLVEVRKIVKTQGPEAFDAISAAIDKAARNDLSSYQPYEDDNDRLDNKLRAIDPSVSDLDAATLALLRNRARNYFTLQGGDRPLTRTGMAALLDARASEAAKGEAGGER